MAFRPRAFLIDLSGTVHVENFALPGAIEAVNKIKTQKIPCLFVTNTTKVKNAFLKVPDNPAINLVRPNITFQACLYCKFSSPHKDKRQKKLTREGPTLLPVFIVDGSLAAFVIICGQMKLKPVSRLVT